MSILYANNNNGLRVTNMRDSITNVAINNATVTAQVYLPDGATTVGNVVSLLNVAGSNGDYQGTLVHTVPLIVGMEYLILYIIDGPNGGYAELTDSAQCRKRTNSDCNG